MKDVISWWTGVLVWGDAGEGSARAMGRLRERVWEGGLWDVLQSGLCEIWKLPNFVHVAALSEIDLSILCLEFRRACKHNWDWPLSFLWEMMTLGAGGGWRWGGACEIGKRRGLSFGSQGRRDRAFGSCDGGCEGVGHYVRNETEDFGKSRVCPVWLIRLGCTRHSQYCIIELSRDQLCSVLVSIHIVMKTEWFLVWVKRRVTEFRILSLVWLHAWYRGKMGLLGFWLNMGGWENKRNEKDEKEKEG